MVTYRIDVQREDVIAGDRWYEIPRVFDSTFELLTTVERVLEQFEVIRIRRITE